MKFIMPENEVKVFIKATNRDLNDRFSVFNMMDANNIKKINDILSNGANANFGHFRKTGIRPFARTKLFLGFDEILNRPVIIKTPKYRDKEERYIVSDYEKEEYINFRREMIKAQVDMLNEIQSPLLPEPIDYFEVENFDDRMPSHMKKNEPVLVLDYQSGTTLQQYIQKRVFEKKEIENNAENETDEVFKRKYKKVESIEAREKFRIIKNIVIFLKELDSKQYAYQGLNPKSILLLRDKTPRFIGLGYICKTKNGYLDENHINYKVCELGYSAPELNNNNIPDDKITAKGISAFSLGVLIHQLIGEYTIINPETVGEYGHFKYPNDYTVEDIRRSSLKGDLVHHLISNLCEEDVNKRLTDYDEILRRIEAIIGSNKRSSVLEKSNMKYKKYDKYVTGVQMIYGDTKNHHCEDDNSLLKDVILGIAFYCRSQQKSLGFINAPGYLCEKCGKAYITEEVYIEEIEECLDEIHNQEKIENKYNLKLDENGEQEAIYINRKDTMSTYKQVSKMTKVNFNINECFYDDEKLEITNVAVAYHEIGDKEKNPVGRIVTKLPICTTDSCKKAYITNKKLEEINELLPNNTLYEFNSKDYKEELFAAYKIKRIGNLNYCYEDLTKLKSYYVRIPYFQDGNKVAGYKVMKLKYCPTCKTYYITKEEEKELKSILPKSSKDTFVKIKEKEKSFDDKLVKLEDNMDNCSLDNNSLIKEKVRIYIKNTNKKNSRYQVLAEVYSCNKCGTYFIKSKEIKRINELAPKGYKVNTINSAKDIQKNQKSNAPKQQNNSTKNAKSTIIGENMILCIYDNHRLTRERVSLPCYDKRTNHCLGNVILSNKLYCSKCSRLYLDNNELEELSKVLLDATIKIEKQSNFLKLKNPFNSKINTVVSSIFKKFFK